MTPILNFLIQRVNSGAKVMVSEVHGKKYAHDIITMIDGERKRKVSPILWRKLGKHMELESQTLGIKIYKSRQ